MSDASRKLAEMGTSLYALSKRTGTTLSGLSKTFNGSVASPGIDIIYRIHLATRGRISFLDFVNPETENEVRGRIKEFGSIGRTRSGRRPPPRGDHHGR